MTLTKYWIIAGLVFGFFHNPLLADANKKQFRDSETELVWKSDRLFVPWFGQTFRAHMGHEGILADRVAVKAGKNSHLKIDKITITYLDRKHHHPQKLHFYHYGRIHHGDRVEFKMWGVRRVIGIKVAAWGWSGSHSRDGFRIVLKKRVHRPPIGWVQTGYFYGECIGGHHCPGYRRHHIKKFSIDLKDVMDIQRIHFFAHDHVGISHAAKVNIYVDDHLVARDINIKKRGTEHTIKLDHIMGRFITFEAARNDEAVIQRISVDYSAYWDRGSRQPSHRGRHDGGHRPGRPFNR